MAAESLQQVWKLESGWGLSSKVPLLLFLQRTYQSVFMLCRLHRARRNLIGWICVLANKMQNGTNQGIREELSNIEGRGKNSGQARSSPLGGRSGFHHCGGGSELVPSCHAFHPGLVAKVLLQSPSHQSRCLALCQKPFS